MLRHVSPNKKTGEQVSGLFQSRITYCIGGIANGLVDAGQMINTMISVPAMSMT